MCIYYFKITLGYFSGKIMPKLIINKWVERKDGIRKIKRGNQNIIFLSSVYIHFLQFLAGTLFWGCSFNGILD